MGDEIFWPVRERGLRDAIVLVEETLGKPELGELLRRQWEAALLLLRKDLGTLVRLRAGEVDPKDAELTLFDGRIEARVAPQRLC